MTLCVFAASWYDLTKEKIVPHGGFSSVATGLIWLTVFLSIRVPPGRVLCWVSHYTMNGDGLELYTLKIDSDLPT